jgi:voltage-gated potassium channel
MQSNFDKAAYKYLLSLTIFMVLLGIIVYHLVEKFSWVDAYYFSVITLATVGYGDLTPHTAFGKIFTTFYIFAGVGIITTFVSYSLRRRAYMMKNKQNKNRD